MRFTAQQPVFAAAVTAAAQGIPGNPTMPIRAALCVEADDGILSVSGSDGDVTFTGRCLVQTAIAGQAVVPGKVFADVVRNLPDVPVHVSHDGKDTLLIEAGRAKFTLRTVPGPYPAPPAPAPECGTVSASDFADAVRKIASSAAKTDSNAAYNSVVAETDWDTLELIASDRAQLAVTGLKWLPLEMPAQSCLIPAWAAARFAKGLSGDITLGWDDRVVTLKSDTTEVTARLLEGDFPKWRTILPAVDPDIVIDPGELAAAVKRAALTADGDAPVTLTFTPGELKVTAGGIAGDSSEVIDCSYQGEFEVLFGVQRLLDGLAGCGDTARIGFTAANKPFYIYSDGYRFMVLPRRPV